MSRDYELARIPQSSAPLVAYVRQLHLAPRARPAPPAPPNPPPQVDVLDALYGEIVSNQLHLDPAIARVYVHWTPVAGRFDLSHLARD